MPGRATIELTGENRDLISEIQQVLRENAKLEEQMRRMATQSQIAGKANKETLTAEGQLLNTMVGRVGAVVASYVSFQSAVNAVTDALQRQERIRKEIAQAQLSTAAAERQFIINLNTTPQKRDAALAELYRRAEGRGISREDALQAAGAGVGLVPGGKPEPVLQALDIAAQVNPYDVRELTPGILATREVTGSENALANAGFLLDVQQYSPIKSTSQLAQFGMRAMKAIRTVGGDTDVEAAALTTAIGNVMLDPSGETSGHAAIRAAAVLADRMRNRPELTSTRERIDYLQQNPKEAARIADKIEESISKAAIVSLISDPTSEANRRYRESMAGIAPGEAERVQIAQQAIRTAGGTSVQGLGAIQRGLQTGVEASKFGADGIEGVFLEELPKLRDFAGMTFGERFGGNLPYRLKSHFSGDPLGTGIEEVRTYARMLEENWNRARGTGGEEQIKVLLQIVEVLEQIKNSNPSKEDLQSALRQNATNDLQTHTEGR